MSLLFLILGSIFLTLLFFFFSDTATSEIYTLSLHDALPIFQHTSLSLVSSRGAPRCSSHKFFRTGHALTHRSEEHTSELQSRRDLVCRLLLEKKNNRNPQQNADRN